MLNSARTVWHSRQGDLSAPSFSFICAPKIAGGKTRCPFPSRRLGCLQVHPIPPQIRGKWAKPKSDSVWCSSSVTIFDIFEPLTPKLMDQNENRIGFWKRLSFPFHYLFIAFFNLSYWIEKCINYFSSAEFVGQSFGAMFLPSFSFFLVVKSYVLTS